MSFVQLQGADGFVSAAAAGGQVPPYDIIYSQPISISDVVVSSNGTTVSSASCELQCLSTLSCVGYTVLSDPTNGDICLLVQNTGTNVGVNSNFFGNFLIGTTSVSGTWLSSTYIASAITMDVVNDLTRVPKITKNVDWKWAIIFLLLLWTTYQMMQSSNWRGLVPDAKLLNS